MTPGMFESVSVHAEKVCLKRARALSILVRAGNSESIIMRIKPTSGSETIMPLTDGAKLNIEIHTAEGIDYPKTVILTSSG